MIRRQTAVWLAIVAALSSALAVNAGGNIVWTPTGGPTGGSVIAIAAAPDSPNMLYSATNTNIFASRDEGANWSAASNGLPDERAITSIAVVNSKTIFAGTPTGIYRTRDAGATWTAVTPRPNNPFVLTFALDPQNSQIIYAGTLSNVLRSDDGGDTWKDVSDGLRQARVWNLAVASDASALYAATDAGVFLSRDRGGKWQMLSDGLSDTARPQAITIASKGAFAATSQGLFRLRDTRWSAVSGNLAGAAIQTIFADPRRTDRVVAATLKGLFRSSDGGDNWTALPALAGDTAVFAFAAGDKNTLYAGTTRGVWKSADDGNTWAPLNTGLVGTSVSALLISPGNPDVLIAATRAGLVRSSDRGKTWREVIGLDASVLAIALDPASANTLYAGALNSAIFISRDNGATFARQSDNVANAPIGALAVIPVTNNARVLYVGTQGSGLLRSLDDGKTWQAMTADLPGVTRVSAFSFLSPFLYAGTDRGLFRFDHSKPNAAWEVVSADLPLEEARAVVADPNNPRALFTAFVSKGVYRSDNAGARWQALGRSAFPTRVRFQSLALASNNGLTLYAGTDRGIYRSDDNGATWLAATDGLSAGVDVEAIAIDPAAPQRVYVGTDGYGVLVGVEQIRAGGIGWQVPAAIAAAIVLALGAFAFAWQTTLSPLAQEREWAREWPTWDNAIHHALWIYGQANEINLNRHPKRKLYRALQRYRERHADEALSLATTPMTALRLDNYLPAQKFLSHWKAAWEVVNSEESFKSVTSEIVDQLCVMLGFTRVEERAFQGLLGYVVKAPYLRLKIPPRFPIIFIPRHEINEEQIKALRDLMSVLNMTSYFALIVDLRDAPPRGQRSLKRFVRQAVHDFIVLDGTDVRRILAARDQPRRLVEIILDQVDLTVVSPYVTSGPVPENMFFGRDHELKTIVRTVRDSNYAIVGGRKIGKTSVLAHVNRIFLDMPDFEPFYLDCQAIQSYAHFFEAIDTLWPISLPERTPEGFRRMATNLSAQYPGLTIIIHLDEVDALLKYDIEHGEQLFSICRALAQEDRLRFIFCGEKMLNAALHNPELAFFNFCNILTLSYLNPDEARRVVSEPMEEMGIALEEGGALVDEIVRQSAHHPNIIQYLCQELIKRINVRHERFIRRTDVNALVKSTPFAENFIEVCWGRANPLERLITVVMLDKPVMAISDMGDALRALELPTPPTELEKAFEGLCLYSLLKKEGSKYAFANQVLPEILRRSQDLRGLQDSLIHEAQHPNGAGV